MATPDADSVALADTAVVADPQIAGAPLLPSGPSSSKNAKGKNIQVSAAVLDAARKGAGEVLRDLRTCVWTLLDR